MTHYDTLGIKNNCTDNEVKQAYRSLSFKYHPDRNKDPDASVKMQQINEAYEMLSDKQKRKQYDMELSGVNPIDNIINDIFNNNGVGLHNLFHGLNMHQGMNQGMNQSMNMQGMNMQGRGMNMHQVHLGGHPGMFEVMFSNEVPIFKQATPVLEKKVDITFEDSFKGNNIPIVIEREIKMGNLSYVEEEKVYITIIKGIDDGEILLVKEKGHNYNDTKGDLKLHIHIVPQHEYERKGLNIIQKQNISFKESICGFERIIKHIDGTNMRLVSSRGNVIQNGDDHTIPNKGFSRDNQTGNLIILFKVIPPKTLNEEELKLFDNILV
jgi:DnaJ-class molecular chaperone